MLSITRKEDGNNLLKTTAGGLMSRLFTEPLTRAGDSSSAYRPVVGVAGSLRGALPDWSPEQSADCRDLGDSVQGGNVLRIPGSPSAASPPRKGSVDPGTIP